MSDGHADASTAQRQVALSVGGVAPHVYRQVIFDHVVPPLEQGLAGRPVEQDLGGAAIATVLIVGVEVAVLHERKLQEPAGDIDGDTGSRHIAVSVAL